MEGDSKAVQYDPTWSNEELFMYTRETAFQLDFLQRLDKEILISQISFKQKAELYNDVHNYYGETSENRYSIHYVK